MNEPAASPGAAPLLALDGVRKTFRQGGRQIEVLRGADLTVRPGEMIALVGPSGAGKSTLLHIAGLLERPSGGRVVLCGEDCAGLSGQQRALLRGRSLGFVYQYHHLLPEFSAQENAMLPLMLAGTGRAAARARAAELLEALGLEDRLGHRPAALSGGEQQRVAIARAVANRPSVLLADEPTGNLDRETAGRVFEQFLKLVRGSGIGALVATHNPALAGRMDRTLEIAGGRLKERRSG
ncbi:MAG: ABC transporter ATP-binding protein [Rhodospirillaceae bacterium]|nr:ABC transporter ATP-binding protein [Rhodospirillaceae bacterium]MYB13596.1 ABC transporter ATP-binding protein [Rhodospirillaceae bacterium]MYI48665.1 ABC transporter ATP-binding protein [Rhodospirillaceae bacterium]